MLVKELISKLLNHRDFSFYMNDKLIDIDELYDCDAILDNFEFESKTVIRLYSSGYTY